MNSGLETGGRVPSHKASKCFNDPKETRPEVSEADPGNQKVTKSKVSKLRPAHRNSKVNM